MAARTYKDLPQAIQETKRLAIDAYMKSQGWDIEGDKYHMSSSGTSYDVTRPGADGEGGGDWDWNSFWDIGNDGQDEKWRATFDSIREDIDAVQPWLDLPDPDTLADDVEGLRQANRALAFSASEGTGGGEISGYLTGIQASLHSMAGATFNAFEADFLVQLEKAIGGHHGITVILGGAMKASQELWSGARDTVVEIVWQTRDGLQAYIDGGGIDWKVVLQVVGYAAEGVGLFAAGGASKALTGAAELGLKVITDVRSEADKNSNATTPSLDPDGLIKGIKTALDELDDAITAEEQLLRDNLISNARNVRADKGSYDLTKPALLEVSDDSEAELIVLKESLADKIIDTYLPRIAKELDAAGGHAFFVTYRATRDPSIGIDVSGISSEFADLQWLLHDLVGDLSWETLNSARTLRLAIDDIGRVDTGAQDALERHAKKVEHGGLDPWD